MALDINGYTATFNDFVQFAQKRMNASDGKAVVNAMERQPDDGGRVFSVKKSDTDHVHKWKRTVDELSLNDSTRTLFKNAVIEMFGGEEKIPASVRKAMLLEDYGHGKPLTARRIIAVKKAIDADGTTRESARNKLETFQSHEVEDEALRLGFAKGEMRKLARAAHFYAQSLNVDEMTAMKAVAEPNSKANRLMQYGGRFLENEANFAEGLRLLDSFSGWIAAVSAKKDKDTDPSEDSFENATTFTDFNFSNRLVGNGFPEALERFVFEELAVNPDADLKETDPEKIFGMKNNAAMRFFGTRRYDNFAGTMASMPPEKRKVVYAVFDKLLPALPETKEAATSYYATNPLERTVVHSGILIGRILRHLPEIERLIAKGSLTEKNIVKTLYPDMPSRNWTLKGINDFTLNVNTLAAQEFMRSGMDEMNAITAGSKILSIMEDTSCTYKQAMETFKTGKRIAPPKYMTTATFPLESLDGTTKAARTQLDNKGAGDLWRAYNYSPTDDPENPEKFYIKNADNAVFGFQFPDGTRIKANGDVHAGNIPTVLDKLEAFAGRVHPRQQSALMFAVSQAGLGQINGGLRAYGILSSEHSCVNFTLSKDENTGAITVKYTSPSELPLRFSWTATIDVDGRIATTPLAVENP